MIFWLSFCDRDRPKGKQFLGVALVEANNLPDAITATWERGCNPGGEVLSLEVPETEASRVRPYLNRLLSKAEAETAIRSRPTIYQ